MSYLLLNSAFESVNLRGKVKNFPHFCFSNLLTQKSFFYIVSFLFDALGPAVHELGYSLHEEGFRLVAQPFMHRFPPRRLVRIAGFRLLASKSLSLALLILHPFSR
jgi:hypothetical protein